MTDLNSLKKELIFKAVRSGGKGGQNVNKVSSKVELYFSIDNSSVLTENEKHLLSQKLSNKISDEGFLRIVSEEERSRLQNKARVIEKFEEMIIRALTPVVKRVKTKTPKGVKEKRIKEKKIRGDVKSLRRKPDIE